MEVPGQVIREEDTKIMMSTAMGDSCFCNMVRGYDLGFETHMHKFAQVKWQRVQDAPVEKRVQV